MLAHNHLMFLLCICRKIAKGMERFNALKEEIVKENQILVVHIMALKYCKKKEEKKGQVRDETRVKKINVDRLQAQVSLKLCACGAWFSVY